MNIKNNIIGQNIALIKENNSIKNLVLTGKKYEFPLVFFVILWYNVKKCRIYLIYDLTGNKSILN